jgi:predicted dehydrogenase
MSEFEGRTAAVIGLGGMGIRHVKAYARLGIRVVAVCDARATSVDAARADAPDAAAYSTAEELLDREGQKVDMVSVVTNTTSRAGILRDLAASGVKRVLAEKPFTTNLGDAYDLIDRYERAGSRLTINTFRHFCDNHIRLRELLRSGVIGAPRYFAVQCASAGLGNMGSVFFDLMNFYMESAPLEVTGEIDRTGTPSVRGPNFRDPAGFGMVRYANGSRGFIDTSEDTGVPYTFHIVTTYGRVFIDELFNQWQVSGRTAEDKEKRPLTFYLTKLAEVPFQLTHGYDVVEMTGFTIASAMRDRPEASNAREAATVMEMIMAIHVSAAEGRTPQTIPLGSKHGSLDVPFA